MTGPKLAASATLFDRLDEAMIAAARRDREMAGNVCEQLAEFGGVRPMFCEWRDQHLGRNRRQSAPACGCGGNGAGVAPDLGRRLAAAERTADELGELIARVLVRELLPEVLEELQPSPARPARLGYWPAGWMPPQTW